MTGACNPSTFYDYQYLPMQGWGEVGDALQLFSDGIIDSAHPEELSPNPRNEFVDGLLADAKGSLDSRAREGSIDGSEAKRGAGSIAARWSQFFEKGTLLSLNGGARFYKHELRIVRFLGSDLYGLRMWDAVSGSDTTEVDLGLRLKKRRGLMAAGASLELSPLISGVDRGFVIDFAPIVGAVEAVCGRQRVRARSIVQAIMDHALEKDKAEVVISRSRDLTVSLDYSPLMARRFEWPKIGSTVKPKDTWVNRGTVIYGPLDSCAEGSAAATALKISAARYDTWLPLLARTPDPTWHARPLFDARQVLHAVDLSMRLYGALRQEGGS